jgi:hypothetical protein
MSGASITKTPTSTSASPRSAILLRLSAAARYARGLQEAGNWRSEPTAAKCAVRGRRRSGSRSRASDAGSRLSRCRRRGTACGRRPPDRGTRRGIRVEPCGPPRSGGQPACRLLPHGLMGPTQTLDLKRLVHAARRCLRPRAATRRSWSRPLRCVTLSAKRSVGGCPVAVVGAVGYELSDWAEWALDPVSDSCRDVALGGSCALIRCLM